MVSVPSANSSKPYTGQMQCVSVEFYGIFNPNNYRKHVKLVSPTSTTTSTSSLSSSMLLHCISRWMFRKLVHGKPRSGPKQNTKQKEGVSYNTLLKDNCVFLPQPFPEEVAFGVGRVVVIKFLGKRLYKGRIKTCNQKNVTRTWAAKKNCSLHTQRKPLSWTFSSTLIEETYNPLT